MSFWGDLICPRCEINLINISFIFNNCLPFSLSKTRSKNRIGPHNFKIIEFIFGSLLGDGYAEKRINSTRILFHQEGSHGEYLKWSHNFVSNLGYCSTVIPKLTTRLGRYGKIRTVLRFRTFSYSSFNWIHECFYKNHKKILPICIDKFLTPLALAIWIMDDGGKVGSGLKLATNNFTKLEVLRLCKILFVKYKLKATIQKAGDINNVQYIIYIPTESMPLLTSIVKPYIHPSMKYKFGVYNN